MKDPVKVSRLSCWCYYFVLVGSDEEEETRRQFSRSSSKYEWCGKKREKIQLIARRFEAFQCIKVPNRWYFIAQMFFLVPTNPLKDRSFSLNYFCQCFCFVPTFCLFDRCFNIRPFEVMQLHISITHANCRLISQGNLELSTEFSDNVNWPP